MIDGQKVFDQPVNNNLRIYDNAKKITTDQRDDYTIGCLLDYPSLRTYYKEIAFVNSKRVMLIQKQYGKLILPEI